MIHKSDITQLKEKLENIRIAAETVDDDLYEPFFEKFYKLLKVLLFLTVGAKKIDQHKIKLKSLKGEITKLTLIIAESKGKIELLNNIKNKLKEDDSRMPRSKIQIEPTENTTESAINQEVIFF